jgi:hypothetical protein
MLKIILYFWGAKLRQEDQREILIVVERSKWSCPEAQIKHRRISPFGLAVEDVLRHLGRYR